MPLILSRVCFRSAVDVFICMARGWRFQAPYLSLRASPAVPCEGTLKTANRLLPQITSTLDKVTLRHQTSLWFKSRRKNQLWLTLSCMCTFTWPLQHEQTHAKHTWTHSHMPQFSSTDPYTNITPLPHYYLFLHHICVTERYLKILSRLIIQSIDNQDKIHKTTIELADGPTSAIASHSILRSLGVVIMCRGG